MKSLQMFTVAGLTAAALVTGAAPSYAQRHRGPVRGLSGSLRPVPRAAMRPVQRRLLTPGFGVMGRRSLATSHFGSSGYRFGYDPFWSGYGMGVGPGYYADPASRLGGVRIKNAPRDAEVYVDGAYAGVVNSFDGRFQRLTLEPGSYLIEVKASGFTQRVNVNVQPGRTTAVSMGSS